MIRLKGPGTTGIVEGEPDMGGRRIKRRESGAEEGISKITRLRLLRKNSRRDSSVRVRIANLREKEESLEQRVAKDSKGRDDYFKAIEA